MDTMRREEIIPEGADPEGTDVENRPWIQ